MARHTIHPGRRGTSALGSIMVHLVAGPGRRRNCNRAGMAGIAIQRTGDSGRNMIAHIGRGLRAYRSFPGV